MLDRFRTAENGTSCEVSRFAIRTLGILASDFSERPPKRAPLESYLSQMQKAVLDVRRGHLEDLVSQMRGALISPAEIAENYVPMVARRLGDCWVEDTLDFRSVSIGSARLQSLLWQLEEFEPRIPLRTELSQANMLVVVPEACQHTLGATVLAGQLRRMGRGVKLELATSPNALKGIMDTADFAGVMISASSREPLASLADLVQTARQSQAKTPILIGGNILEKMSEIKDTTGADLITSDVDPALRFCGLLAKPDTAQPLEGAE